MRFLSEFAQELIENHNELFVTGIRSEDEDFHRDSERYQTLMDLVNLEYADIEVFYDKTSMGKINGGPDRHH